MIYGTAWHSPLIVFARNDGNLTRMETLLCMGEIQGVLKVLVNQIENMAVYPEELLFEPELVVRGSTGRPGPGSVVGSLPPFCTQSALVLESARFRTRRHGHPGA